MSSAIFIFLPQNMHVSDLEFFSKCNWLHFYRIALNFFLSTWPGLPEKTQSLLLLSDVTLNPAAVF